MRRVDALTGWGGGPTWFEIESDLGMDDPDPEGAFAEPPLEVPIVIVHLHAATSPDDHDEEGVEVPPSKLGVKISWMELTCALNLEQARELRRALDDAIEGVD